MNELKTALPAGKSEIAKQYYGLDVMKTVMAVLVIIIHRSPFESGLLSFGAQNIFGRLAVPFFFAAAGFLFFGKAETDRKKENTVFFRYMKRLVILYIVWTAAYMPAAAYRFDFEAYGLVKFILNYAKRSLLEVSIIHLWYLLALIVAVSIVFILAKKLGYAAILAVSMAVYGVYLLITEFEYITLSAAPVELFKKAVDFFPVDGIKNGFFIGFVFVAVGAYVSNHKIKMPDSVKISFVIISLAMVAAEALLRRHFGHTENLNVALSHIPATFMLIVAASQVQLKPKKIYGYMRRTNSLIYFSHLLIITEWYKLIFEGTALEQFSGIPAVFFFFTLAYTLAFSFAVVWLEEKKHFGFLKYIH